MNSKVGLEKILYRLLLFPVTHRPLQDFLKGKLHELNKLKKKTRKIIRKEFGIKSTKLFTFLDVKKLLKIVLPHYENQMDEKKVNPIRIGIDGVKVGKRKMITCVVLTFPFIHENLRDVRRN